MMSFGHRSLTCSSIILMILISSYGPISVNGQNLTQGFYNVTCPLAQSIVQATVKAYSTIQQNIAPGLLKLLFSDCLVEGCDGSVLISGPNTEKTAEANLNLGGFQVIDEIKRQIEIVCPGVVSCADILALAARDAVVQRNGPSWEVKSGRKDGLISLAANVENLPSLAQPISTILLNNFAALGFNTEEFLALLGIRLTLDTGSEVAFNASIFEKILNGSAVFKLDQSILSIPNAYKLLQGFTTQKRFDIIFMRVMTRLSEIGVKTGVIGEIRRNCSKFNI